MWIGVPTSASSHSSDLLRWYRTWAWMRRIRTLSFQPSPRRSIPPGIMISMSWRMFWRRRRTPWSVSLPVVKNDLLMRVVKPQTMLEPTSAWT